MDKRIQYVKLAKYYRKLAEQCENKAKGLWKKYEESQGR